MDDGDDGELDMLHCRTTTLISFHDRAQYAFYLYFAFSSLFLLFASRSIVVYPTTTVAMTVQLEQFISEKYKSVNQRRPLSSGLPMK